MRDAFIWETLRLAKDDDRIMFLSADFGAEALDDFREQLPEQFVHCGISEQHMIDLAVGLALAGKRPICYAMAPFISLRCLEQIKMLAMMDLPVVIVSAGVGLGYANSGPTHYLTEDHAIMRSIPGVEVMTAADDMTAAEMPQYCLSNPAPYYIRLDREPLPNIHAGSGMVAEGFGVVRKGKDVAIVSCGWGTHLGLEAAEILQGHDISCQVVDVISTGLEPIGTLSDYFRLIAVVEEQTPPGGLWSSALEMKEEMGLETRLLRFMLDDGYYFDNAGRRGLARGIAPERIAHFISEAL